MLIIFILWKAFVSKQEVLAVEIATPNLEWLHGCAPPYPMFQDPTYVNVK